MLCVEVVFVMIPVIRIRARRSARRGRLRSCGMRPRSTRAAPIVGGFACAFLLETQYLQALESGASAFPLPPDEAAQLTPDPPVQFLKDALDLGLSAVGCPPHLRPRAPYRYRALKIFGLLTQRKRLLRDSCSSGPCFACGFLQIPPRDEHPCRPANSPSYPACKKLAPSSESALPGEQGKTRRRLVDASAFNHERRV